MSFTTPYVSGMRLGQGFNSFTREICIDDAVLFDEAPVAPEPVSHPIPMTPPLCPTAQPPTTGSEASDTAGTNPVTGIHRPNGLNEFTPPALRLAMNDAQDFSIGTVTQKNQTVTYSSQKVDHLADVLSTLSISAYLSVKYGSIKGGSSAAVVNENKFSEADLRYLVSVKVVNESTRKSPKMRFSAIEQLRPADFTAVFGDHFICDFLEGGELSALIMIKTGNNTDTKSVQEAVEAQIQTGIPGLEIGGKESIDKKKSNVLNDCDIDISVSWTGGGQIRPGDKNWTIAEIISLANAFPNLVAKNSQRTSAVLINYNALRSFQELQAQLPERLVITDYTPCHVYTRDFLSVYMAYKVLWSELTTMLSVPEEYQALTHQVLGKDPVQTDPISLNEARRECREQMARIVTEVELLKSSPHKSLMATPEILDATMAAKDDASTSYSPYKYPALLKARLPRFVGAPLALTEDLWKDGNWTADEMAVIMKLSTDRDHLHFSPPIGDLPKSSRGKAFCTVDTSTTKNQGSPKLLHLAVHGHKHQLGDDLLRGNFGQMSYRSRGAISHFSHITASTTSPSTGKASKPAPCKCSAHFGAASACPGVGYYNSADVSRGITKVEVGYAPGSGRVASMKFYDKSGNALLSWDMYNCVAAGWKPDERQKVEIKTVRPPQAEASESMAASVNGDTDLETQAQGDGRVGWELTGFWGRADLYIQQVGIVWRRV